MKAGFTDGQNAVVTAAAVSGYFLVVDEAYDVETQGRMTGLAGIAGGEVIAGLAAYGNKAVVMTAHATGRQALVKKRSGEAFRCNRGDDKLNGSLTGGAAGPDHQLRPVFSPDVGHQAGIAAGGIVEHGFTAAWSGSQGPVITQRLR